MWGRRPKPFRREDAVSLELSGDEALVLFDWVSRFNDEGDATFRDQAEQRVLWDIEAMLERQLVSPFGPYAESLARARARVRDSTD